MKQRIIISAALLLPACAADVGGSDAAPFQADGLEDSQAVEATLASKVSVHDGYFMLRRVRVACPEPAQGPSATCSELRVRRLNQKWMTCEDKQVRAECRVAAVSLRMLRLSADEEGTFLKQLESGRGVAKGLLLGAAPALVVTAGWAAPTAPFVASPIPRLAGSFYRVQATDKGPMAYKLNVGASASAGLKLTKLVYPGSATLDSVAAAEEAAERDKLGIIVMSAGVSRIATAEATANEPRPLHVRDFYLPVKPSAGNACGVRGTLPCLPGQFCRFPVSAMCGAADAPGVCADRSQLCPQNFQPVCGCNGVTYSNQCAADSQGVSVSSEGRCKQAKVPLTAAP